MRRTSLFVLLLLGLVTTSCTDDGDELAGDAEAAQLADTGLLPEPVLDGAVMSPSASDDAAPELPDASGELDAAEPNPPADAAMSAGDVEAMDAGAHDAGLDSGASTLDAGASDAGKSDAGGDAGRDGGSGSASDSGANGADASADAEVKLDAAVDNGPNTFGRVYASFRNGCRNCHQEGAEYSLNLGTREAAYAELVGGPNKGAAEFIVCANMGIFRVIPGDPARSMLVQKLENKQTCGDRMPPNGSLSAAQIQEVRNWIALGALDN